MSESTQEQAVQDRPAPVPGSNSERYDLRDLFDEMGPETETVYKTIGIVLTLVFLGLALAYPILVSRSDASSQDGGHDTSPAAAADH